MKRILYIMVVVCSMLVPLEKADVAKLQPVEAAYVQTKGKTVSITTDTGAYGEGANAAAALSDLVQNTPGIVYLDTAKYLLLESGSEKEVEYIRKELKGSVQLCIWDGEGEMEDTLKYLSIHGKLPKLRSWNADMSIPVLLGENFQKKEK